MILCVCVCMRVSPLAQMLSFYTRSPKEKKKDNEKPRLNVCMSTIMKNRTIGGLEEMDEKS